MEEKMLLRAKNMGATGRVVLPVGTVHNGDKISLPKQLALALLASSPQWFEVVKTEEPELDDLPPAIDQQSEE